MQQRYKLIEESSAAALQLTVQAHLDEGWELWMNHQVVRGGEQQYWYSQAMVRYTDNARLYGQAAETAIAPFSAADIGAVAGMIAPMVAGLVPVRLDPSHPVWTVMDIGKGREP